MFSLFISFRDAFSDPSPRAEQFLLWPLTISVFTHIPTRFLFAFPVLFPINPPAFYVLCNFEAITFFFSPNTYALRFLPFSNFFLFIPYILYSILSSVTNARFSICLLSRWLIIAVHSFIAENHIARYVLFTSFYCRKVVGYLSIEVNGTSCLHISISKRTRTLPKMKTPPHCLGPSPVESETLSKPNSPPQQTENWTQFSYSDSRSHLKIPSNFTTFGSIQQSDHRIDIPAKKSFDPLTPAILQE